MSSWWVNHKQTFRHEFRSTTGGGVQMNRLSPPNRMRLPKDCILP